MLQLGHEKAKMSARSTHIKTTISLLAQALADGEQTREFTCPACSGGVNGEKSFSLKKESDRILYKCWRASCGIAGGITNTTSSLTKEAKVENLPILTKVAYMPRTFAEVQTNRFPEEMRKRMLKDYGLFDQDFRAFNIFYSSESNRIVFPVLSPDKTLRGYTLRSFNVEPNAYGNYPKWDAYPIRGDLTWMGWYGRYTIDKEKRPLIIVEDAISALKVSRNFMCGFLNGTSLDVSKLMEILRTNKDFNQNVVFCLDADATTKAVEYLKEFQFFLGDNAHVLALTEDLKYTTDNEIKELFKPFTKT